jgi:single-strand DNA-binding protein
MYQQILLIGHLGNSPESRYTPSGVMVTAFRMATSQQWTDANGERKEKVVWWRVSVWGKMAEPVAKYLHKGSKALVIGEVEPPNVYTNKAGEHVASLEVKAQTVRFLDSRRDEDDTEARPVQAAQPTTTPDSSFDVPF